MSGPASPPHCILIVRLTAIGDIIMASGVIPCLRSSYPDARIAWLVEEGNEDLLRHNPRLDRVFVWPRRRWRDLRRRGQYRQWWNEFRTLHRELKTQRFDWVLDLQGLLKSAVWAWLAGGRRRIGLGSKEGSHWLVTEVVDRTIDSPLIAKEYRQLMAVLGTSPERFAMDIAVPDEAQRAVGNLLKDGSVTRPYAVLCPFTTRPQKHWFDERWVQLAAAIRDSFGLTPVIVGGPGERERGDAIAAGAGGSVVNLAGSTSLAECAAVIQRASLVVGVDTGWTHLGVAMNRPTLTLLGSTDPYFETGSPRARVLHHPLPCFPCYRHPTCDGAYTCMRLHTVDNVFAAAQDLLREGGESTRPNPAYLPTGD